MLLDTTWLFSGSQIAWFLDRYLPNSLGYKQIIIIINTKIFLSEMLFIRIHPDSSNG